MDEPEHGSGGKSGGDGGLSELGWLKVPCVSSPPGELKGHHSLKSSKQPVRREDPSTTTFLAGKPNCSMPRWICLANEDGLHWRPLVDNPPPSSSSAFSPSGVVSWSTPA